MLRKENFSPSSDYIFLQNVEVSARVGHTREERAFPQIVLISIKAVLPLQAAGRSDSLIDTVDYARVLASIRSLTESKEFVLLEGMAERIVEILFDDPAVRATQVTISKKVFVGVEAAGVSIFRENPRART